MDQGLSLFTTSGAVTAYLVDDCDDRSRRSFHLSIKRADLDVELSLTSLRQLGEWLIEAVAEEEQEREAELSLSGEQDG